MAAKEIIVATVDHEQLGLLTEYVLHNWPSMKAEVQEEFSHTGYSGMRLQ